MTHYYSLRVQAENANEEREACDSYTENPVINVVFDRDDEAKKADEERRAADEERRAADTQRENYIAAVRNYGPDVVATTMSRSDELRSFWEFATTVRRARSTCTRTSAQLRGTWLTQTLVVQRIEGWGLSHVRLLCVVAPSEVEQIRLARFFDMDMGNVDGGLLYAQDPLDNEPRAIVKVPYATRYEPTVIREYKVLSGLMGVKGVPQVQGLVCFTDVNVTASVTEYVIGETLQEWLERGSTAELSDLYGLYRLLTRSLGILASAHACGWLHAGLQPRHVIIDRAGDVVQLCGWSSASLWPPPNADHQQGLALIGSPKNKLLVKLAEETAAAEEAEAEANAEVAEALAESINDTADAEGCDQEANISLDAAPPSLYSAPEDFLSLAVGQPYATPATDVYRVAAVGLVAVRAYGPLGAKGRLTAPSLVNALAEIRSRCNEAILARSQAKAERKAETLVWRTSAKTLRALSDAFRTLLESTLDDPTLVTKHKFGAWFAKALAKEPRERYWTTEEALHALEEAWKPIEHIRRETKCMEAADAESRAAAPALELVYQQLQEQLLLEQISPDSPKSSHVDQEPESEVGSPKAAPTSPFPENVEEEAFSMRVGRSAFRLERPPALEAMTVL